MIRQIIEFLAQWIISVESSLGLAGIILLMGIESACIPLPSEIIMPFAGYLITKNVFTLWQAGLAGAIGCVIGSLVAYYIGVFGGRPFAEKYGKYILLNPQDLALGDRLFERYGEIITFVSRLLPMVRTFIALPAGISRMNVWRFSIYTFLGSLPWCLGLAWVGQKMGENWPALKDRFHQIDLVIAGLLFIGLIFWIRHHLLFLKTLKTS